MCLAACGTTSRRGFGADLRDIRNTVPQPVQVIIAGSTWGGSMLKMRFIGRGMHLEFHHPAYSTAIITSPIQEIREPIESVRNQRTGVGHGR